MVGIDAFVGAVNGAMKIYAIYKRRANENFHHDSLDGEKWGGNEHVAGESSQPAAAGEESDTRQQDRYYRNQPVNRGHLGYRNRLESAERKQCRSSGNQQYSAYERKSSAENCENNYRYPQEQTFDNFSDGKIKCDGRSSDENKQKSSDSQEYTEHCERRAPELKQVAEHECNQHDQQN